MLTPCGVNGRHRRPRQREHRAYKLLQQMLLAAHTARKAKTVPRRVGNAGTRREDGIVQLRSTSTKGEPITKSSISRNTAAFACGRLAWVLWSLRSAVAASTRRFSACKACSGTPPSSPEEFKATGRRTKPRETSSSCICKKNGVVQHGLSGTR